MGIMGMDCPKIGFFPVYQHLMAIQESFTSNHRIIIIIDIDSICPFSTSTRPRGLGFSGLEAANDLRLLSAHRPSFGKAKSRRFGKHSICLAARWHQMTLDDFRMIFAWQLYFNDFGCYFTNRTKVILDDFGLGPLLWVTWGVTYGVLWWPLSVIHLIPRLNHHYQHFPYKVGSPQL